MSRVLHACKHSLPPCSCFILLAWKTEKSDRESQGFLECVKVFAFCWGSPLDCLSVKIKGGCCQLLCSFKSLWARNHVLIIYQRDWEGVSEMLDLMASPFLSWLSNFTDCDYGHRFAMMQNKQTSFQLRLFQYKHSITKTTTKNQDKQTLQ